MRTVVGARGPLLITGPPGIGKTTLIIKLAERLREAHPVGFYTGEIREQGVRKGFKLIGLSMGVSQGAVAPLSHVDIRSPYKVGTLSRILKDVASYLEKDLPQLNKELFK